MKGKGSKKFRKVLFLQKEVKSNTSSWKKSLKDYSITTDDIKKAHEFNSEKILHPKYHDKKFHILARKTQFNDQLSKHNPSISENCQYCDSLANGNNMHIKEDMEHALLSCQNVKNLSKTVLTYLKI